MMSITSRTFHKLAAITITATCLLSTRAIYGSPAVSLASMHAFVGKTKTVKINVRNDSAETLKLQVGDNVTTVEAGKTVSMKLPEGSRIITNTQTKTHKAGDLILQVSSSLNGATLIVS